MKIFGAHSKNDLQLAQSKQSIDEAHNYPNKMCHFPQIIENPVYLKT